MLGSCASSFSTSRFFSHRMMIPSSPRTTRWRFEWEICRTIHPGAAWHSLLHPRFKSTYIEAERLDYMKVKAAAEMESLADEQRARHCHQSELLKKFLLRKRRRIWAASSKEDHVNAKLSLGQRESPLKWSLTAIYRQLKFTVRPNTLRWDSQSKQLQIGSKFFLFFIFFFLFIEVFIYLIWYFLVPKDLK